LQASHGQCFLAAQESQKSLKESTNPITGQIWRLTSENTLKNAQYAWKQDSSLSKDQKF
jgi:predicted secreted protein